MAVLADYTAGITYKPHELVHFLQSMQQLTVQTSVMRGETQPLEHLKVGAPPVLPPLASPHTQAPAPHRPPTSWRWSAWLTSGPS